LGGEDQLIWESRNGKYSCADTWENMSRSQEVPWWKVVWWPMAIPKHSFFLWLLF